MIEGWNHNTQYHTELLRAVPRPCARALDVGCGTGSFARQLATKAAQVDALDRAPEVLASARDASNGVANLRFVEADFMTWPVDGGYDFVSMIASLHHLPFAAAVARVSATLRPGGVLAVIGIDRPRSLVHAALRSSVAYPASRALRLLHRVGRGRGPMPPLEDPSMTLDDIRREAAALLPGAVVTRRLLWRYTLIWVKPGGG